ncbi:MAG: helix-turn-helix domain-containing protein [Propionibacteriaceae bacterium]|jgi:transcriptional regulator with XRE-family HTH domain|nr:helix-turn-helix domain-containing protein [Propionibacteriaceae bacterium]
MIHTPKEAGLLLRSLRQQQGLTQTQLAEKARVSPRWLINFEAGKTTVDMSLVMDCYQSLGYGMDIAPLPRRGDHG